MPRADDPTPTQMSVLFRRRLTRIYLWYTLGFIVFALVMGALERMGMPKRGIGITFLLPAVVNGMATGADWMSAASFIGLAGTLYLQGYGGLAFIMGWTGGYCLVALLIAPYLRKFGQFTIPDFLGARYGSNLPRFVGVLAAMLCSFIYVVAQIYGVGLITTRLTGVDFVIGIFLGLGGILVCSFLGGMRAVTWTQVAQYIILIIAFMIPVLWLSVKQTGVPLPLLVYGTQLQKVTEREHRLLDDPKEIEVIAAFRARAESYRSKLENVPQALQQERRIAQEKVADLRGADAPLGQIQAAEKALAAVPKSERDARETWSRALAENEARARPLAGMPPHGQQFAGDPRGDAAERAAYDDSRRNFFALVFCLMVGTAALPHILVRSYTTPTVREARQSVAWSLFFIFLLYVTAPALAVLVQDEVPNVLVGTPFDRLPAWIANWAKVDPSLLSVVDVNHDGVLQLGEMKIGADIVVLATPEIGGVPDA